MFSCSPNHNPQSNSTSAAETCPIPCPLSKIDDSPLRGLDPSRRPARVRIMGRARCARERLDGRQDSAGATKLRERLLDLQIQFIELADQFLMPLIELVQHLPR